MGALFNIDFNAIAEMQAIPLTLHPTPFVLAKKTTQKMKIQNYKSHRRLDPVFHGVTLLLLVALLGGSLVNLFRANHTDLYADSLIVLIAVSLCLIYVFVRRFPLKAQDRAIRAEENLRYFVLTGKLLDRRLTTNQIIALRFASDEEFVALAKKAVDENMDANAIKKSIQNWRGDFHRV